MGFGRFRTAAALVACLLGTACGDLSTAPVQKVPTWPVFSGGCDLADDGKTILCPPQSPDWGDCDEYHYDCGGDDCIASAPIEGDTSVEGCTGGSGGGGTIGGGGDGGGGTGGGGGGTGKTPLCPDYGCPAPEPSLANDLQRDTVPPSDCADPSNTQWQKLYCRSSLPNSTQLAKVQAALDRIAQRGQVCATLAQTGRNLLASGGIRFFTWTEGDAAGYGHPNTGIQMPAQMLARYDPAQPDQDFEHVLVHEIDHVLRLDHISNDGWDTPHTAQCEG